MCRPSRVQPDDRGFPSPRLDVPTFTGFLMQMRSTTLVVALAVASSAAAQAPQPSIGDSAPTWRRTAVVISPLGFLLGSYAADVEHATSPFVTVGVGATFQDAGSVLYCCGGDGYDLDASGKVRVYPNGEALRGFSLGVLAGGTVHRRRSDGESAGADSSFVDRGGTLVFTYGVTADYNWLARRDRRLLLGTGFGFKRRVVRERDHVEELIKIRPTLRAVIGYTF